MIELVVSIAILGIVGAMVVEVVLTLSAGTRIRTDQVGGQNEAAALADALIAADYQACATRADLERQLDAAVSASPLPSGYAASIGGVQYAQSGAAAGWTATCPPDNGAQLLELQVVAQTGTGGAATQTISFVKRRPCPEAAPC